MNKRTFSRRDEISFYIVINLLIVLLLALLILKRNDSVRNILLLIMFLPSITAIIFQKFNNISIKQFLIQSIRHTNLKSIIFAVTYPLLFVLTGAVISLLTGLGTLNTGKMLNINRLLNFAVNAILTILPAIGEEYGWRGYLLPRLIKIQGKVKATISLSIVWVLYHIPVIYIIAKMGAANPAVSILVQAFSLFVLAFSFSYCYYISNSIIAVSIMHAFWNSVNTWILGDIFSYKTAMIEGNIFLINGEGLIGLVLGVIPMIFFIKKINND